MVSTRGLRYKFTEGERVLCYEPDPTKAKVLYDSKVLEVVESKDKRGRRTVEYLIHFQGWNSSWDRCVSEDFVLKDTEENRQLQRDLAEKSQLQLGAYLYRRERKKGGSTSAAGAGPAKRTRHGFSDDGSSTSTQPDEVETADTDSSSASAANSQPRSPPPNNNPPVGRAHITLPFPIRDRLTFDFHIVVKRGRLSRLPASPCVVEILESFVKWYARAGAWHQPRARHDPPQRPDLQDVSCRLNLVREVADGIRVYFDFILRGHLLYKQELHQYHEICGKFIDEQEGEKLKYVFEEEECHSQDESTVVSVEEDLKSPKIPEYSHLPPDPTDCENNEENWIFNFEEEEIEEGSVTMEENNQEDEEVMTGESVEKEASKTDSAAEETVADDVSEDGAPAPASAPAGAARRIGARRLRSHKSVVSQSENEEPAPSTSTGEPRTFETLSSRLVLQKFFSVGSSGSSMSEGWTHPPKTAPVSTSTRTPLSLLLEKVAKWQMIPRDGTEHLPCRVYGAIHLARLFVRLPDFLNASQMPDCKLRLIVRHIDMFVQYLNEHSEWFGESYYVADSISRSH
ncbi:protein male-specific lethal-3 isoform X1 [Bombyx mandarina]|uniref:Protein male-specific lethal-3 n=1 Tax=Bombyx mandarina TaxID=7092 RepID=A0A6J2JNG1_BOMMA|nr:protein male-specific lethal-3 isoform X1 [Bombyx mandarina]